jgi:hypothetical protein
MDDAEIRAERELIGDVSRMADLVVADLRSGHEPTAWKQRRKQIAVLRQRIRTMRARHLGGSFYSWQ